MGNPLPCAETCQYPHHHLYNSWDSPGKMVIAVKVVEGLSVKHTTADAVNNPNICKENDTFFSQTPR